MKQPGFFLPSMAAMRRNTARAGGLAALTRRKTG